jgi:uncharacterized membrane protein YukC
MAISFFLAFVVSSLLSPNKENDKVFALTRDDFKTSKLFNIGSFIIVAILAAIYINYA